MLRIVILAAVLAIACRWLTGKWPWQFLQGRPTREQARFHARKLLGVSADAGREDIRAAHRRLVTLVHPDKGGTDAQVHEANAARDLLLSDLPDEPS